MGTVSKTMHHLLSKEYIGHSETTSPLVGDAVAAEMCGVTHDITIRVNRELEPKALGGFW